MHPQHPTTTTKTAMEQELALIKSLATAMTKKEVLTRLEAIAHPLRKENTKKFFLRLLGDKKRFDLYTAILDACYLTKLFDSELRETLKIENELAVWAKIRKDFLKSSEQK